MNNGQYANLLVRLGQGDSVADACQACRMDPDDFPSWWQTELAQRVPPQTGTVQAPVGAAVEIHRDARGVPHIFADRDTDLYFAYGYAMALDRLWQLDCYRRQAQGTLAEILGADACPMATGGAPRALDRDIAARTIGFQHIARRQWAQMAPQVKQRLEAFAAGINQVRDESLSNLPIEFALLDYSPAPWHPLDTLAVWIEFQYYLTVRLPVIVMPELARRELPNEELYQAYLAGEADSESILPAGPGSSQGAGIAGRAVGEPEEGVGSNNWVVAGTRTARGHSLLASDPHIAFNAVSCWYEAHLADASGLNVAGAGYIGVPGVLFGRNMDVAWGITNNICSQRDLYLEQTDPRHPDQYRAGDQWVPVRQRQERIAVRNGAPVDLTVRISPNGPIVNHLLPDFARDWGPVSLKWMGAVLEAGDEDNGHFEIGAMMQSNRARNCHEFRSALRSWRVPTLSMIFADVQGHIGYQCTGRIPLRTHWQRGFRRGWHRGDAWVGSIPFVGLPAMADPGHGWIRTANNRTASDDFPFPLSGTWASGYRARRIRHVLEENSRLSRADCMNLQMDTLSLRAVECLPHLQDLLQDVQDERVQAALDIWTHWNRRMDPDTVGSTLFETFFALWQSAVAAARFSEQTAGYLDGGAAGLAVALLKEDAAGWFADANQRRACVLESLLQAWQKLSRELGPDPAGWQWQCVHKIRLDHPLAYLPAPGELLNRGGQPVGGSGITICNTGVDPNYMSAMGANYRIVAELDAQAPVLYAVDAAGQSGHAGSPHYCDQLPFWLAGQLQPLLLERAECIRAAQRSMVLQPEGCQGA